MKGREIPLRQSPRQAGEKDGAVAVLDLDGNNVAQIPTGGHPEALQREEKGNRIFNRFPPERQLYKRLRLLHRYALARGRKMLRLLKSMA